MCRQAKPFILSPIAYPEDYITSITAGSDCRSASVIVRKHVVQLALDWRNMLAADKTLTMAKIARSQRVSRARVTQIMNLLHLPHPIIKELHNILKTGKDHPFSERILRNLLLLPSSAEQTKAFNQIRVQSHPNAPS